MADESAQKSDGLTPKIALGVAAHPDDLDFGMAGTIAKWAAAGCAVYYLVLTNGNKGSADRQADPAALTKLRRDEQRAAAGILGVKEVIFKDYDDGMLEVTMDLKRDIVRVIRKVRPDVVLTMDPGMLYDAERGFINHPDHRAAGQAAIDAVFPLARDHMSFPEIYQNEGLEPHITPTLLLMNFGQHNYTVDITATMDTKLVAIRAHTSQIPDTAAMETRMRQIAARLGAETGVTYAEAFQRIDIRA